MDSAKQAKNALSWFFIILLVFLLIIGVGKLLSRSRTGGKKITPGKSSVIEKVTPSSKPATNGTLSLQSAEHDGYAPLESELQLQVVASSDNVSVVGYDLALTYDPSIVAFVSSSPSLSNEYESNSSQAGGKITVSGILKKDVKEPLVFADTVIEVLKFKPLKVGKTMITFSFNPGTMDESNLISKDSRDILGKVIPFSLTVGNTMELRVKETKPISGTEHSLRLDKITVPQSSCRDCFTSQDLTFLDPSKKTQVSFGFRSGGFVGALHDEARVGGYIFKLYTASSSDITVLVVPE